MSSKQGKFYESRTIEQIAASGHKVLGIDHRPGQNLARGGWPDIISIKGDEVHVWEVKSGNDHEVHEHQLEVLGALHDLGAVVHIIRYTDLKGEPKEEIWDRI